MSGDRDQQQAAEDPTGAWLELRDAVLGERDAQALAAALAYVRADEAARWRAKIEALATHWVSHGNWGMTYAARLRALLDGEQR